jgi:hypothetical protein
MASDTFTTKKAGDCMDNAAQVTISVTEDDLRFLLWATKFLDGGLHGYTEEPGRMHAEFMKAWEHLYSGEEGRRKFSGKSIKATRKLVVRFSGGFRDGEILRIDSENQQEAMMAMFLYVGSEGGKVGHRFPGMSTAGKQELHEIVENTPEGPRLKREPVFNKLHVYKLIERNETEESLVLRYEYEGKLD